jgi:N-acetylglucosaminyldiphosphoundecaprenol N-acetyl-beta-D-mannosaminyltransferase
MTQQNIVPILGVNIRNYSKTEALALIESWLIDRSQTRNIYIVNAHTLNLATENPYYHTVLNLATSVFADGTGARWAARIRGVRLKDNLVGTDLVPRLFHETPNRGYKYFLLGADASTIQRAADFSAKTFGGWALAGYHHGYSGDADTRAVIEKINAAKPNVLLVGMGNPLQEIWLHRHRASLRVPVCIGVGGLFDHWAGNLQRAPSWVRERGFEWLQLLAQQPHKWRRYLLGNPKFLMRILRSLPSDRRQSIQS